MHNLSIFFMGTFSLKLKQLGSFPPGGINGLHSFRMGNRVNFNLRRFAQKAPCSKQNAKSVRSYKMVQIFAGFPLHDQAEAVLVLDVSETMTDQTTHLIFRWFNH